MYYKPRLHFSVTQLIPLLAIFVSFGSGLYAQKDTITQRIILIGDAGQLTDGRHPVVDGVKKNIPLDDKTIVLFLGDNLYEKGLPDQEFAAQYVTAKAILDSQISIADNTPARVYMIPGNHDWNNGKPGGYDAIIRQQVYVDAPRQNSFVAYYPKDGCPGPDTVHAGDNILIIMFDSQWWLHPHDKPGIESDCSCKTKDELVDKIRNLVTHNPDKLIILASHHPFKSNGIHGGFFTLKQHLFPFTDLRKNLYIPLPVIGSIYPIARSVFGTPQDLPHPNYANMVEQVTEAVTAVSNNVIFVAGHDHNLQHIKQDGYNYVISGGGCKQNRTSKNKNSFFNTTDLGFSVLEVSANNNVTISFYTVMDSVVKRYDAPVLNFTNTPVKSTETLADLTEDPYINHDSVAVSASKQFRPVKGFKRFFMGQNYRKVWSAPVKMKVLRINNKENSFSKLMLGGGRQTTSVRMVDTKGKEWVLRNVEKKPTPYLSDDLFGNALKPLTNEMNSASYPYAALIFPGLAEPLNIPVARPQLYYVPNDTAFGIYRNTFAGKVAILEERSPSIYGENTRSTAKFISKMLEENDHLPDETLVLQARLLDMITGDYHRHLDQWRWGTKEDTGKGKIYYPIPRDRDQAFFNSNGFVLKTLSNKLPFLKGFKRNILRINWLGYHSRDFDRLFLNGLNKDEWNYSIEWVQNKLTDSVIHNAVQQLPPEIYALNGRVITQKMIRRRNQLQKEAMEYYRFLSRKVNIVGSNQREYFRVTDAPGGLQVRVYSRSLKSDTSYLIYNRTFDPAVTREIRLYGLNDDDLFYIDENANSKIKLRVIGGRGNDTFDVKGPIKTFLYDLNDDINHIKSGSSARNRFSTNPLVNDQGIHGFEYDRIHFPLFNGAYNSDDDVMVGGGIHSRTYGFQNEPFATDQQLSGLYSFDRRALKLKYQGEFNHIAGKKDLVIHAAYSAPELRNFFGYGNASRKNAEVSSQYYQTRYKFLEADILVRKRLMSFLHIMIGPYYQVYWNRYEDNTANILGDFHEQNMDSARLFSHKAYAGGKFVLLLDNRNNTLFPKRGIEWRNEFFSVGGLTGDSKPYSSFSSDMTVYASRKDPARIVTVLRFGGTRLYGKGFEFFQAASFGQQNGMAAFRKNRFTGHASLYGGVEFRLKLFDINSYMLPGPFGLTGFYNIGRVWWHPEDSKKWHNGIGGGFYFIPFDLFILSGSAGFYQKEKMFSISLGTRLNMFY